LNCYFGGSMSNPLHGEKRLISIDIIRGLAIMGILLVNAPSLNGPPVKDSVNFAFQNSFLDIWYSKVLFAFAVGKFYPIFALLFGISVSIFLSPSKNLLKQRILFIKRQLALLLIGLMHITLVWWGDILTIYSILGLFLLPLSYRPAMAYKVFWFMLIVGFFTSMAIALLPAEKILVYSSHHLYSTGTFLMLVKQRIIDTYGIYVPGLFLAPTLSQYLNSVLYLWQLLLLFVLGFYLNSSGIIKQLTSSKSLSLKAIIAMSFLTILAIILASFDLISPMIAKWKGIIQGLFYISLLLYGLHNKRILSWLSLWANVGRMSLSNYLFHTITLSLIFYGYGLGLYGQIGPYKQIPIIITLISISLIFSTIWLKYFNFGPIEWLWRALTYGQFSPMIKKKSSSAEVF
jgi:uncharacterized protein